MRKLFTNDKFFFAMIICTVIGSIFYAVCGLWKWPSYSYIPVILLVNTLSTVALFITYKTHNKNAMKGLVGFALMGLLALTITTVFPIEFENTAYTVISLINLIVVVLICLNHFIINSDRHPMTSNIRINQILFFVMFALYVALAAVWVNGMDAIVVILYMFGVSVTTFGFVASIVCVESRLDSYRIDRELSGWTEKEGYPEGYVHEYQKKNNK